MDCHNTVLIVVATVLWTSSICIIFYAIGYKRGCSYWQRMTDKWLS